MNAPTRTITIVVHDGNSFDVFEGDRCADRLCWDEMLGQIASMTHPAISKVRYAALTPEEREERTARWRAMREKVTE